MKNLLAMCLLLLCAGWQSAWADTDPNDPDVTSYEVVVYQNEDMGEKFSEQWSQQMDGLTRNNTERGFLGDLFTVTKATGAGLITGQVTSLITTGVNAIAELTKSRKNKWQNVMKKANTFETTLMMLQNLEDFYSTMSTTSAMDPSGMSFDGIGCLQMRGRDTVLYLSCHLDTTVTAMSRIFRHSKFQLRLDTLVFSPVLCDLPNDSALKYSQRDHFDFEQRDNLRLRIEMAVTSSWINQAIQVVNDQPLGQFTIVVPIEEKALDPDGVFRFYRGNPNNRVRNCNVNGECFIVPRSYVGIRDDEGNFHDAWGTGQYKVTMTLKETCTIAPKYLKGKRWKDDYRAYRRKHGQTFSINKVTRSISQYWDKNKQQWITTFLDAPAQYIAGQGLDDLGVIDAAAKKPATAKKK